MPKIIPIRELRDTNAISEMCHNTEEPVFITKKRLWRYGNYESGNI